MGGIIVRISCIGARLRSGIRIRLAAEPPMAAGVNSICALCPHPFALTTKTRGDFSQRVFSRILPAATYALPTIRTVAGSGTGNTSCAVP
jgi:hypothetical protein